MCYCDVMPEIPSIPFFAECMSAQLRFPFFLQVIEKNLSGWWYIQIEEK